MVKNHSISFVVEAEDEVSGRKGGLYAASKPERREIPLERLQESLKQESEKLLLILESVPKMAGWSMNEVEVGIDVSAEGGISFIGTAKLSSAASIKLKFKR